MGAPHPEQAILEELSRPPGRWEPAAASAGGIESGTTCGGNPFEADLSTVRFVKHRRSEQRHLYFVTFEGTIAQLGPENRYPWRYVFPVQRDPSGGWRVRGGAGGAGDEPERPTPWVNLAGGGWPDQFYAGGHVHRAGIDIARVELQFANGLTLEDNPDADVALFITEEKATMPAILVLLADDGNQVATQRPFPNP